MSAVQNFISLSLAVSSSLFVVLLLCFDLKFKINHPYDKNTTLYATKLEEGRRRFRCLAMRSISLGRIIWFLVIFVL